MVQSTRPFVPVCYCVVIRELRINVINYEKKG